MEKIICLQTKVTLLTKTFSILLFFFLFSTFLSKKNVLYLLVFVLRRRFIFLYIVIGDWHASEVVEARMTKV